MQIYLFHAENTASRSSHGRPCLADVPEGIQESEHAQCAADGCMEMCKPACKMAASQFVRASCCLHCMSQTVFSLCCKLPTTEQAGRIVQARKAKQSIYNMIQGGSRNGIHEDACCFAGCTSRIQRPPCRLTAAG